MKAGEQYENLKKIIFLAIVDFIMFPNKKGYKSSHKLLDQENGYNDLRDFHFTFIELPKFKKDNVEDLKTDEERWCYFFKHSDEPQNILRLIAEDAGIEKA